MGTVLFLLPWLNYQKIEPSPFFRTVPIFYHADAGSRRPSACAASGASQYDSAAYAGAEYAFITNDKAAKIKLAAAATFLKLAAMTLRSNPSKTCL